MPEKTSNFLYQAVEIGTVWANTKLKYLTLKLIEN